MQCAPVCCERVALMIRAWPSGTFVAASQNFGKRLQERLVLLARAVGDAQRAGAAERAAAAHEHAALLEASHDLLLAVGGLLHVAAVAEVKPAEVGLRVGG